MTIRRIVTEIGRTFLGFLAVMALVIVGCGAVALYIGTRHPETDEQAWARMCAGPERYDAMREADAKGKPNPC